MDADRRAAGQASGLLAAPSFPQRGRALLHWTDAQRAALLQVLGTVHAAWCEDWGLATAQADGSGVRIAGGEAGAGLDDAATRRRLAAALLGDAGAAAPAVPLPSAWEDEILDESIADWQGRLAACTGRQAAAPGPDRGAGGGQDLGRPWSGALTLAFAVRACAWQVRLSGRQVQTALGLAEAGGVRRAVAQPLASAAQALSPLRVGVRVELAPVALRLGQLRALQVGDVLQLAHRLDQPLHVGVLHAAGGEHSSSPLCSGWLGRRGQRVAVQCAQEAA